MHVIKAEFHLIKYILLDQKYSKKIKYYNLKELFFIWIYCKM